MSETPTQSNQAAGPIADLSYRTYTGPKSLSKARWWPIAKNGILVNIRKRAFWGLTLFCFSPYVMLAFFLYIEDALRSAVPTGGMRGEFSLPSYPEFLANAFRWSWLPLFFMALLVGTGSIAADNRANALQVYLSKPITKRDYLAGKWASIFLVIYALCLVPMVLVTLYAAFSQGLGAFFKDYPLLLPKLFVLAVIPAALHASLLSGLSAWNKTPWLVGVIYTGAYVVLNQVALIVGLALADGLSGEALATVRSLSIEGAATGLAFNLIGAGPTEFSITALQRSPIPYPLPLLLIFVSLCAVGIVMARSRIQAVEVVQG